MTRQDNSKVSWVEFLRSIQFDHRNAAKQRTQCSSHFAHFEQKAPSGDQSNAEDSYLIRSGN